MPRRSPVSRFLAPLSILWMAAACGDAPTPSEGDSLAGAWRSRIHFTSGALAGIQDLEFMYVFNAGGTLTESSNYDGSPPVPPAYGLWKKSGPRRFEAKYTFYVTRAPQTFEDITKGGGWAPSGYGVLTEIVTLSEDGKSYKSTIAYAPFDPSGKPIAGGGTGTGAATRMSF